MTEARMMPAFKDSVKITIQRLYASLQKQMGAARCGISAIMEEKHPLEQSCNSST